MVVIGPLTARYTEPVAARITRGRTHRAPVLTAVPSPAKSPEAAQDQDPAGRT
ncbi:hypothetical protein ACIQNK_38165 [Streptomyces sp. NPDC091273]|uniref:hypothetical protein n=1 Tax=Streptomyces sp. NPDC091273 TaxID=3365982 RepID=UPI00382016D4